MAPAEHTLRLRDQLSVPVATMVLLWMARNRRWTTPGAHGGPRIETLEGPLSTRRAGALIYHSNRAYNGIQVDQGVARKAK